MNRRDRIAARGERQVAAGDRGRPLLTVMIASMTARSESLRRLLDRFAQQAGASGGGLQILVAIDDGEIPLATKRNTLLDAAAGDYIASVDDDDLVGFDYVSAILDAIRRNPGVDCITFEGLRTVDGGQPHRMIWSLAHAGNSRAPDGTRRIQVNHICPIRAGIAKQSWFPSYECSNYCRDISFNSPDNPVINVCLEI